VGLGCFGMELDGWVSECVSFDWVVDCGDLFEWEFEDV
jgi:hypothetical protein